MASSSLTFLNGRQHDLGQAGAELHFGSTIRHSASFMSQAHVHDCSRRSFSSLVFCATVSAVQIYARQRLAGFPIVGYFGLCLLRRQTLAQKECRYQHGDPQPGGRRASSYTYCSRSFNRRPQYTQNFSRTVMHHNSRPAFRPKLHHQTKSALPIGAARFSSALYRLGGRVAVGPYSAVSAPAELGVRFPDLHDFQGATRRGDRQLHAFSGVGYLPFLLFQETLTRSVSSMVDNSNFDYEDGFPGRVHSGGGLPFDAGAASAGALYRARGDRLVVVHHASFWMAALPFYMLMLGLFAIGIAWIVSASSLPARHRASVDAGSDVLVLDDADLYFREAISGMDALGAAPQPAGIPGAGVSRPPALFPHSFVARRFHGGHVFLRRFHSRRAIFPAIEEGICGRFVAIPVRKASDICEAVRT